MVFDTDYSTNLIESKRGISQFGVIGSVEQQQSDSPNKRSHETGLVVNAPCLTAPK
jgi:hypothetical protein